MSNIDVDENTHPEHDVESDENVSSECESRIQQVHVKDNLGTNFDFCRILEENDLALGNAIEALQKS
ncbi:hypothetical protein BGZ74_004209, partial [Mortierella antarctica]